MEDLLPLLYLLAGAFVAFGGVVYSERRTTKRQESSALRDDRRDTVRRLQSAYLDYETAAMSVFVMVSQDWNDQEPPPSRVWHGKDQSGDLWQRWAEPSRLVTALRSELDDRDLAALVQEAQEEFAAILTDGPESPSDEHAQDFRKRVVARASRVAEVIEAIGEAYRKL